MWMLSAFLLFIMFSSSSNLTNFQDKRITKRQRTPEIKLKSPPIKSKSTVVKSVKSGQLLKFRACSTSEKFTHVSRTRAEKSMWWWMSEWSPKWSSWHVQEGWIAAPLGRLDQRGSTWFCGWHFDSLTRDKNNFPFLTRSSNGTLTHNKFSFYSIDPISMNNTLTKNKIIMMNIINISMLHLNYIMKTNTSYISNTNVGLSFWLTYLRI